MNMYKDKYLKYKKKYLTLKKIGSGLEKKHFFNDKSIIYNYLWIQQKKEREQKTQILEQVKSAAELAAVAARARAADEKQTAELREKKYILPEIIFDSIEKDYNKNKLSNIIILGMYINFGTEYKNFTILNKKSKIYKLGFKTYYENILSAINHYADIMSKEFKIGMDKNFITYMEDNIFKYIKPSGKKFYNYGKYYDIINKLEQEQKFKEITETKEHIIKLINGRLKPELKINISDEIINNITEFIFYKHKLYNSNINDEISNIIINLVKNKNIKLYLWIDSKRHKQKQIDDTRTYLNKFCLNIEIKDLNELVLFQNDMIKDIYSNYYNYDFYYKVDLAKLLITLEQIYLDNSVYSIFTDIRIKVFSLYPENIVNKYTTSKLNKFGVLFIRQSGVYENSFHIMKYNSEKIKILLHYICKLIIFIYNFDNNISISGYLNFFEDNNEETKKYLNNYIPNITQLVFSSLFDKKYGNLKMELYHANSIKGGGKKREKFSIKLLDIISKTIDDYKKIGDELKTILDRDPEKKLEIFKHAYEKYKRGDEEKITIKNVNKDINKFNIRVEWNGSRSEHKHRTNLPNKINFWHKGDGFYTEFGRGPMAENYNEVTIYRIKNINNNTVNLEYYDIKNNEIKTKDIPYSHDISDILIKCNNRYKPFNDVHINDPSINFHTIDVNELNLYKYNIKLKHFKNNNDLGIYHFFNKEENIFGREQKNINTEFIENGFTIGKRFGDESSYGNLYDIIIDNVDKRLTDKYCIKIIKINPKDKHNISIDKIINEYIIQHYLEDTGICPKIYGFFYIKNINRNYIINNIVINNIKTFIKNNYDFSKDFDDDLDSPETYNHLEWSEYQYNHLCYYENNLVILLMEKIKDIVNPKRYIREHKSDVIEVPKYNKIYIKKLFKLWDKGIIHNDLHSQNVITTKSNVYIIDFGHSYFINNLLVKYTHMLQKEMFKLQQQYDELKFLIKDDAYKKKDGKRIKITFTDFIKENYNTNDYIKLTNDNIKKFYKLQEIKYKLLDRINNINIIERNKYKIDIKKLKFNLLEKLYIEKLNDEKKRKAPDEKKAPETQTSNINIILKQKKDLEKLNTNIKKLQNLLKDREKLPKHEKTKK